MQMKLITTGFTLAAAILMCTAEANAGWGSWGGSSGGSWGGSSGGSSGGSWGSSGGSSGGYSSGGSWGSHGSSGGGLFARWHARRAARKWCHSSGGSHGYTHTYYGSSGGSWGGSSGGSSGGSYVVPQYSTPMNAVPMEAAPVDPNPPATPPSIPPAGASLRRDEGGLTVNVPNDAKIFVNGKATTTKGSYREYISRGLKPGFEYNYEVRAEVVRNGETITDVKTVSLTAGRLERLDFDFASESVETVVTLNVPADAKVTLAGNKTSSTGETREFRTTGLAAGQTWNGYDIVVSIERDGQTLTKEQTIDLNGGQSVSLDFDFDSTSVASR